MRRPSRGRYLLRLLQAREELGTSDLLVLANLRLDLGEAAVLRRLAHRVLDFDQQDVT